MKKDLKEILTQKQYDEVMYVATARAKKKYLVIKKIWVEAEVDTNKPKKTYPYPLDLIYEAVMAMSENKKIDITVKSRKPEVVEVRQVFQFFSFLYSNFRPDMLEEWTGWDRCTYYHSIKAVMNKYDTMPYFRLMIDDIDKNIRNHLDIEMSKITRKGIIPMAYKSKNYNKKGRWKLKKGQEQH